MLGSELSIQICCRHALSIELKKHVFRFFFNSHTLFFFLFVLNKIIPSWSIFWGQHNASDFASSMFFLLLLGMIVLFVTSKRRERNFKKYIFIISSFAVMLLFCFVVLKFFRQKYHLYVELLRPHFEISYFIQWYSIFQIKLNTRIK